MRSSGSRSVRTRAMSSSSFAPLAEAVPKVFRPFVAPSAQAAAEPAPAPAPGPSAEEICYERELLELALGVARKVVQQELAERPEIWLGMIREAVRRAVDHERIAVRMPPAALAFLRQALPELRSTLEDVK